MITVTSPFRILLLSQTPSLFQYMRDPKNMLVYRLNSLPDPYRNLNSPWYKKKITPLRDRSMVDWIFEFKESENIMNMVLDRVRETLEKMYFKDRGGEEWDLVVVGLSKGQQVSVGFIEMLYMRVIEYSKVNEFCVLVERRHPGVMDELWGKNAFFRWQYYCSASKKWLNYSQEVSDHMEDAFTKLIISDTLDNTTKIDNLLEINFFEGKASQMTQSGNFGNFSNSGNSGTFGNTGTIRNTGTVGNTGTIGNTRTCGYSGTYGYTGTCGNSGTFGNSGFGGLSLMFGNSGFGGNSIFCFGGGNSISSGDSIFGGNSGMNGNSEMNGYSGISTNSGIGGNGERILQIRCTIYRRGAGILPYCEDELTGKIFFLFGVEKGLFTAFGGNENPEDHHNLQETAIRETLEESHGCFADDAQLRKALANPPKYSEIGKNCFLVNLGIQKSEHRFEILRKFKIGREKKGLKRSQQEMNSIIWVSGEDLRESLIEARNQRIPCLMDGPDGKKIGLRKYIEHYLLDELNNPDFISLCIPRRKK